ncbi:hypothetical protein NE237_024443 [Protea cynaroides]|uniref:Uncharacterized protein n=1 Tax=Protea cynaroides TaxID=273540 RepID=A0A9Q0K5F3_9MAGN|nr:hypothetical protein NE237_024443 [Protea cynaroides]
MSSNRDKATEIPPLKGLVDKRYPLPVVSHEDVVSNPTVFWETLRRFHSELGERWFEDSDDDEQQVMALFGNGDEDKQRVMVRPHSKPSSSSNSEDEEEDEVFEEKLMPAAMESSEMQETQLKTLISCDCRKLERCKKPIWKCTSKKVWDEENTRSSLRFLYCRSRKVGDEDDSQKIMLRNTPAVLVEVPLFSQLQGRKVARLVE